MVMTIQMRKKLSANVVKIAAKFLLKLFILSGILTVLILLSLFLLHQQNFFGEIIFGYSGSLLIFMLGFISMCWVLAKSIKTFLMIVLGGIFIKFLLLAASIYLIMRYTDLDIMYYIITFVFFYIFFQYFEFRFVNRHVLKGKKGSLLSTRD